MPGGKGGRGGRKGENGLHSGRSSSGGKEPPLIFKPYGNEEKMRGESLSMRSGIHLVDMEVRLPFLPPEREDAGLLHRQEDAPFHGGESTAFMTKKVSSR